ncbi:hypothetical protein J4226_03665 [Candidatus Pacearchaeota archaeon]|nr:hypothetical protein [Candidatus Pacearchaeota archaeon]
MDRKKILIGVGILILVVGFWYFYESSKIYYYPAPIASCEKDADCVVDNIDISGCECEMRAINLDHADYLSRNRAKTLFRCNDLSCEQQVGVCIDNICEILEDERECMVDSDCTFVNLGDCKCDFIPVNKKYVSYFLSRIKDWDNCELFCEVPLDVKCFENQCSLEW